MKSRLAALTDRIDALSIRERLLVTAAALGLVWLAWSAFLIGPLDARRAARERETAELQGRLVKLTEAAASLAGQAPELVAPRREIEALETEIAALDAELAVASAGVIEPKRMAQALEELLERRTELALVELAALPPQAVQQDGGVSAAYRHGIVVVVEGPYLATLRYLEAIQSLPYRFTWESVELEAVSHPINRTRIVLYTLGLDQDLLGG